MNRIKTYLMAAAISFAPLTSTAQKVGSAASKCNATEVVDTLRQVKPRELKNLASTVSQPTTLSLSGKYVIGSNVTNGAMGVSGSVARKNATFSAEALYGKGHINGAEQSTTLAKIKYNKQHPVINNPSERLSLGTEVGLHGNLQKVNERFVGYAATDFKAAGKYEKSLNKSAVLNVDAGAGFATPLKYDNKKVELKPAQFVYDVNAGIKVNETNFHVGGGKDVHYGNHVSVGVTQSF